MSQSPVYITGAGIITAIGLNRNDTLEALRCGRSGIASVEHLVTDHHEFPVGEVKMSDTRLAETLGLDKERTPRTVMLGIHALREAVASARLGDDISEATFISGTTVGGMDRTEQHYLEMHSDASQCGILSTHDCGTCSEMIADDAGRFAHVTTISTACSSSANAILLGARMISLGQADIVVAGGSESLTKYHLNGFNSLMILDREPCCPFDATRTGLNLGEGAAFVVLESESSVKRRGMTPSFRLDGWGNACDAFHQTASSENGEGAFLAMQEALRRAGVTAADIDYVNAHGTGTPNNDASESAALRRVFGDSMPPVSSTKSMTGHTTSASGSIETVICMLAMQEGLLPANLGFRNSDPACVTPVSETKTGCHLRHVLCNSFGFGGNDTSLLITKMQE